MRFSRVSLESWGYELPQAVLTSQEIEKRLSPLCKRLGLPSGFFEIFTGIRERKYWDKTILPSEKGILSAKTALSRAGIKPSAIDCLIHVSVSRDCLEPATAGIVHHGLGLPSSSMFFDLSNACLGFLNGAVILAHMIELGTIKRGLLVGTENASKMIEITIDALLKNPNLTLEEAYEYLPSLTLGCGSAAMILSDQSVSKTGHPFLGAIARSASEFHGACLAHPDSGLLDPVAGMTMRTDASLLMREATRLAGKTWEDFKSEIGWENKNIQHIFTHQVGRMPREEMIKALKVSADLDFPTFSFLGNMGSASLPISFAMGIEKRKVADGDHIALLGFGSGINCLFAAVKW